MPPKKYVKPGTRLYLKGITGIFPIVDQRDNQIAVQIHKDIYWIPLEKRLIHAMGYRLIIST